MRPLLNSLKKAFPIVISGMFILILSACGTQNQKYNSSDGVYSSEEEVVTSDSEQEIDKTNYYKQYFKSKTGSYEELPEDGAIFTDIDAYSTTDSLDEEGYIVTEEVEYQEGYGAWGSNSDNVSVNIYNGGGYGYGGWGMGYGGWGMGYGWGIGFGWGFGGGWGYPYYGGYYCSPYYGGYYNPYYNNGYGYGNNISYNRGRRNTDYLAGRSNSLNRSNRDVAGRGSYARSEMNRRGTTTSRTRPSADRASGSRSGYSTRSTARTRSTSRSTSRPTSRPTSRSTSRPTSRPTSRSTSRPTSRSTSRPTSRPASSSSSGRSSGGRSSGSRSSGGRGGRG